MEKINQEPIILSIDTSCDETAVAITVGRKVYSNVIWSQIEIHRPWGGVVPDLAKRAHEEHIDQVVSEAIKRATSTAKRIRENRAITSDKIDAVAVTQGPGLAIALEISIKKAKEIAIKFKRPLIVVDHMEGHLLSSFALNSRGNGPFSKKSPEFPVLAVLVSGGHTQLIFMENFGKYRIIGETLDDAAGEAFDKVAKMLNLGYPGGPIISELAKNGNPKKFDLPIPMARNSSLNFSFSGLKTSCLYKLRTISEKEKNRIFLEDFSASFEKSLVKSISLKLKKAVEKYQPRQIILGGGVINNLRLRQEIRKIARKYTIPIFVPYSKTLLTDNAAMIGIAAYFKFQRGEFVKDINGVERLPNLSLTSKPRNGGMLQSCCETTKKLT